MSWRCLRGWVEGSGGVGGAGGRDLAEATVREEWWTRYGWNRPQDPPPYYAGDAITVRKVEIHDAYDLKRWYWKGTDGIRETTWPGVYNRSRLPGRNDYFQLPDWDCYVDSGKAVTFVMPDEPWNQIEIAGAAWGKMELLKPDVASDAGLKGAAESVLFERGKGQEKTVHTFATAITGRKIRFTNEEQEEPISELVAYNVHAGREPEGTAKLAYRLTSGVHANATLNSILPFILGRFQADERQMMTAVPVGAGVDTSPVYAAQATGSSMPLVHIVVPDNWDKVEGGLDGIAIDLPAMGVKATHGELFPMNIQVKDPLWNYRDMMDFTFSVKPGEAKTLWLDLRDRILPVGKGFYITIAGAGQDFGPGMLEGAEIRLVFKSRESAVVEHEEDRFTQVKDVYAMLVEEHPASNKLNMWNRFVGDLNDLMRVNPKHELGRYYSALALHTARPEDVLPEPPAGVPLWAYRQVELLGKVKEFANYYIDHRQVEFGDFGGGLSDDTDLTNIFPGIALMGCNPEKIIDSNHRELEACFNNGMFTNGICTIQADYLHNYEEGTNCLGQNLILDYGNPRQIERAMANARAVEGLTGVNAAGNRLFKSFYYNGKKMSTDDPWGATLFYSYLVLQPEESLLEFNGNPVAKKTLMELADGMLAHRHVDAKGKGTFPSEIRFVDDSEVTSPRNNFAPVADLFWLAWKTTGDAKYVTPIKDYKFAGITANFVDQLGLRNDKGTREVILHGDPDAYGGHADFADGSNDGEFFKWQLSGNKEFLVDGYTKSIQYYDATSYIYTEGSLWIDRVSERLPFLDLQRSRLGGVALVRNAIVPGHVASWKFKAPANDQSVAILIPDATPTGFKVIAYNLESTAVTATMTGWNIDPGMWEMTQGIDTKGGDVADQGVTTSSVKFERTGELELTFPPRATTVITLKLKTPGTPYWQRPDLGICKEDVVVEGTKMKVTVHSIGAVDAPASVVRVLDKGGKDIATAAVPALAAPTDLMPRSVEVTLTVPAGDLTGGSVQVDAGANVEEITQRNNRVGL